MSSLASRVRVVAITDRRQVSSLPIAVRALLAAAPRGSVAVQVREKDLDGGPLLELTRQIVEVAHELDAPVWVNERVDVALAARAAGVHLPERSFAIADAQRVIARANATLAIGVSRHTPDDALVAANAGADLVQIGPIWEVVGKAPPLGPAALAVRARMPTTTRLVAVGGVDSAARAFEAARAGADAVAVIRAAWSSSSPATITSMVEAVERGRSARIDSHHST